MNKYLLCILLSVFFPPLVNGQNLSANEIIKRADDKNRGLTSKSEINMTIVRSSWSRTVSFKTWSKGNDYALVLITAPPKEKGQVFLKRKTEMWNWVPSIDKIIKIPPSMMMQSWMGSDFTNDDLVKQSSLVKDYTHRQSGMEKIRGFDCYKIELVPLPDASVVWGKIIMWISHDGFDVLHAEYFDEDLKLINIENSFDLRKMGDRTIPTRVEIEPVSQKGHKTILEIVSIIFDQTIPDAEFSQQNMKKVR
jgi:outer membrane lipoprotein-sorting protein